MGTPASDDTARMLAALDAADRAHTAATASGDTAKAEEIANDARQLAAMIRQRPTENVIPAQQNGNTSGGSGDIPTTKPTLGSAIGDAAKDVAGVGENALQMGTGAIAAPVAGIAGLAAAAARGLGIPGVRDPADVVRRTQDGMTYSPRTDTGQEISQGVGKVAGLIPEGADAAGSYVADKSGSPALGAAVNTGIQGAGMLAMGALPKVPYLKPVVNAKNYVSDILPGGASRASTRIINQYANSAPGGASSAADALRSHLDAERALEAAGQSGGLYRPGSLEAKYGITPTASQLANNTGLATLDRTLRTQGNGIPGPLNAADTSNRGAVVDILNGISGTAQERLRAATARDYQARTAYDDALNNPDHFVQPPAPGDPSFAAEAAAKKGLTQDGTTPVNDPNAQPAGLNDMGTRLQEVLQRPAMETAMKNAKMQAANRGVQLDSRNLIQQLHYAKMDLDGQISAASRTGDSTTMGGLLDTKNALLGVMDDLSPAYSNARKSFQVSSAPLNRMDVGEALRQKYLSAQQEASGVGGRPATLLDALRRDDGDTIAKQATGFNGATLDSTLRPQDLEGLQVIRDQLGREHYAQNAGRGVGSNTGENLANQETLDSIGNPRAAVGDLGTLGVGVHNPLASLALGVRGTGVRQAAQSRMAATMADPEATLATLLKDKYSAPPSNYLVAPAVVGSNAEANNEEGHADGGPVEPQIQKSNFWDLVKQAYKEATAPSDPAPPPPVNDGSVASGSKGADFDKYVNRNVDAMSQ